MLRQKIENILLNSYMALNVKELREDVLDEIMNEISKEVYGKPLSSQKEQP